VTGWLALIVSDPAAVLFLLAVVGLAAMLLGMGIARWVRERRELRAPDRPAPEPVDEAAIGRWVEEGWQLFHRWQEQVERVNELQSRLAAMAQEIGRLQAQLGQMDALHAETLRLNQQIEALVLERDQLRTVLARIGELIQRATGDPKG
jgi:TolA-binding protein